MPYHQNVDPNVVVNMLNYMIDKANSGKSIFYDFYTQQQKQQDPAKKTPGFSFFGESPAPLLLLYVPKAAFRMSVHSMKVFRLPSP
jgi:hypothetical protein